MTIHFVGRSCRLPQAPSVAAFADLLYSGRCAITEIPLDRWRKDRFFHPVPGTKGKSYSFAAGIVEDATGFDPVAFGITPREAEYMDPQQRMLLEVVWEALEDACIVPADLAGTKTGVFVGASMTDHGTMLGLEPLAADSYIMTGNSLAVISNRISHVFDLHGPSMTIDTACSSFHFALDAASKALRSGEIDTAIVGGTNLLMSPSQFVGFAAARMLSPSGLCQAFSEHADGYVRAEGAVAFVLRRVDHDSAEAPPRSYGQLLDVGINTSGQTVNVALPSGERQFALISGVYARNGISPDDLAFVEAHGTGTKVGDPIEADAMGRSLGQKRSTPLLIGSVKSNIGHLEPAAGGAGILKALIALERGALPPTLHVDTPNSAIPFDALNLQLATTTVPLPVCDGRRIAGVSSYGFGGANAHAIVMVPEPGPSDAEHAAKSPVPRDIFFTSAHCPAALAELARTYRADLFDPDGQKNVALLDELLHFRGSMPQRLAIVCDAPAKTDAAFEAFLSGKSHPAVLTAATRLHDQPQVFLFSGNGSQYPGMSLAALEHDAGFAAAYDKIDAIWRSLSGWSLIEKLHDSDLAAQLADATIAQPLLFADQIAMTEALAQRGVTPAAVLGHSGGERAAACCSGAMSLEQSLDLIFRSSLVQATLAGRGSLSALRVSQAEAEEALAERPDLPISISAINSPRSVTLVGPVDALANFAADVRRERRWACVPLKVNYPFHSAIQDEIESTLRASIPTIVTCDTDVPYFSPVTGALTAGHMLDIDYWWSSMRQPVRFQDAMRTAARAGFRAFFEIGPNPVLTSYANECLADEAEEVAVSFATKQTADQSVNPVLQAVGRALVHGHRVDRTRFSARPRRATANLVTYPWQNQSYRADDTARLNRLTGRGADFHPLLGLALEAESHVWLNEVDIHVQPALAAHVVSGRPLLPGSALAELAIAAAARCFDSKAIELRDLDIMAALPLHIRAMTEIRTSVILPEGTVRVASRPRLSDDEWRTNMACRIAPLQAAGIADTVAPDPANRSGDLSAAHLYWQAAEVGLTYGTDFQRVSHLRLPKDGIIEVILKTDRIATYDPADHAFDPVGADAVLHGIVAYFEGTQMADARLGFIPVHIGKLQLLRAGCTVSSGRITVRSVGGRSLCVDVSYFDAAGSLIAQIDGMRFRAARLATQIDFASQSFGMDMVPLGPLGAVDGPAAERPDIPALAERIGTLAARIEDDTDPLLLLDAIVQRIGYDALSKRAGTADPDAVGLIVLPDANDDPARGYISMLLDCLVGAGLAEPDDSGWRLLADPELPEADDLITGVHFEHPELIHEVALLSRLQSALPLLLAGKLPWSLAEVYGRAAIANLRQGGVFGQRRADLLVAALRDIVAGHPVDRPLRIAEISDGAARLLSAFGDGNRHPGLALTQIVSDDGAEILPVATANGTSPEICTLAEISDHGPFDLIVCSGEDYGPSLTAEECNNLRAHLATGGLAAIIAQDRRDYLDLVFGVDAGLRQASEPAPLFSKATETGTAILTLADPFGGATLRLLASDPQAKGGKPTTAVPPRAVAALPDMPDILARFATSETIQYIAAAQLWIAPSAGKTPQIIFAPVLTDDETAARFIAARILHLQSTLSEARPESGQIWLVAPQGAGHCDNNGQSPGQAALWAFMRTAKNEYPGLEIKCIDSADAGDRAGDALAALVRRETDETEIVLTPQGLHALRVRQGPRKLRRDDVPELQVAVLANDPTAGLDGLGWCAASRNSPGPTEVVVEVAATGLNYRDVMWAMGLLPEEALEGGFAGPTLGIECAGRIVALGPDVRNLVLGDQVLAFGPGCFASHVTVDQGWVAKLPAGMSPEAAATVPVAFFTAYYALEHLARLRADETVLIHGGAGGVGLAAIQIALWRGARIIATAGSDVKRSLLRSLGVDHVLDSRNLNFVAEVNALTDGKGVDVVLNSLAGIPMERSLGLLRPFGRFLELGKQDFYANTSIGLRALKDNISYHGVDLDQMLAAQPNLAKPLFTEMMQLFHDGVFLPLPYQSFAGRDVIEGFRTMQRSGHIGKIVIRPVAADSVTASVDTRLFKPDPEKLHVIVGGAGGLGLVLMDRWVRAGARAVALIGRSAAPGPAVQAAIAAVAEFGADIRYVSCDIVDAAALNKTLTALRRWAPLSVVVHTAMVLDDMRISDLTAEVLDRALAVKVTGMRNLDLATRGDRLDHFVAFTSMATLIGNHGQSAYVAANGYVEGVIRQRRAAGLPGLAVGWGAILDAGYLSRDLETANLIKRFSGNVEFSSAQAIYALDLLLGKDQRIADEAVLWISPMAWSATVQALRLLHRPTHRALWRLGQASGDAAEYDDLRDALVALPHSAATSRLVDFLMHEIARILRVSGSALSATKPVSDYGMDSLMGVELGLAAQQALGDDIPIMSISESLSMKEIAVKIVDYLHSAGSGPTDVNPVLANLAAQHLGIAEGQPANPAVRPAEAAE